MKLQSESEFEANLTNVLDKWESEPIMLPIGDSAGHLWSPRSHAKRRVVACSTLVAGRSGRCRYCRVVEVTKKEIYSLTRHRLGYFRTHDHLRRRGRGIRNLLSREPMVVSSPARRHSKALHETSPNHT